MSELLLTYQVPMSTKKGIEFIYKLLKKRGHAANAEKQLFTNNQLYSLHLAEG